MISVIVPFSRPGNLARVLANFDRQVGVDKRLILVENGAAVGSSRRLRAPGVRVLESEAHQSAAKNEALRDLRARGGGRFAVMDDDDVYGPGYLAELERALDYARGGIVGKRRHWVAMPDGLYLFDRRREASAVELTGGTHGGYAEAVIDYPMLAQGEDVAWCRAMEAGGERVTATSIGHYIYNRRGAGHTWKASALEVRFVAGSAERFPFGPPSWRFLEDPPPGELVAKPAIEDVLEQLRRSA